MSKATDKDFVTSFQDEGYKLLSMYKSYGTVGASLDDYRIWRILIQEVRQFLIQLTFETKVNKGFQSTPLVQVSSKKKILRNEFEKIRDESFVCNMGHYEENVIYNGDTQILGTFHIKFLKNFKQIKFLNSSPQN